MVDQQGLDFEAPQIEPESPPPAFVSAQERKVLAWRAIGYEPAPCGESSGEACPTCGKPILVDDDFAATFGAHVECFQ
jgi:hypothetical protein